MREVESPNVFCASRPGIPELAKFLDFWEANLDGKVHSVKMTARALVTGNEMRFAAAQLYLH